MHPTAMSNAKLFFDVYMPHLEQIKLLDIGSQDVNGSMRDVAPRQVDYLGVDFEEGKGVDIVLTDAYRLPFDNDSFDVVISSSCFEHAELFWLTYLEALRVLKPHGLLYVNAPSNGSFHRYPVDCWRFYPDAGRALVTWARRNGVNAALLESYIGAQGEDQWNDFVAIFIKDAEFSSRYPMRILDSFQDFENGVVDRDMSILNLVYTPEDARRAKAAAEQAERTRGDLDAARQNEQALAEKLVKAEYASETKAQILQEKLALLDERSVVVAAKDALISEKAKSIAQRDATIADKDARLTDHSHRIDHMSYELGALRETLRQADVMIGQLTGRNGKVPLSSPLKKLGRRLKLKASRSAIRGSRYDLIRDSMFFDADYYLSTYPDVKAKGFDPVVHYLLHGSQEGRNPGPYFSELRYRSLHPDISSLSISALEHYERHGRSERRQLLGSEPRPNRIVAPAATTTIELTRDITSHPTPASPPPDPPKLRRSIERLGLFDPQIYLEMHEDLRLGGADPAAHFFGPGLQEGRRFTSPELVARAISRSTPDIQDAIDEVSQQLTKGHGESDINRAAVRLTGAKIAVYCNSHGNFFMQEIANLLQWQLNALGVVECQLRNEESDPSEQFDVRIFVAPHEFFWLGRGPEWRPFVSAPGSVLFNVEQMQTPWFCAAFPFLLRAPLILDINFQSSVLLRKLGCRTVHYMPPYLPECKYTLPQTDASGIELVRGYEFSRNSFDWTQKSSLSERPVDVLFIGTGCERRLKAIESLRSLTDKYRFLCVYTQQNAPLNHSTYRTTSPEINCALAQRSKIVLNIHRDWIGYFEWSRMVMQGFWQGACVVSDPSLPDPIFTPGEHFLEENIRHMPAFLEWLLGTPEGRQKLEETSAAGHRRATSSNTRAAMLLPMLTALHDVIGRGHGE